MEAVRTQTELMLDEAKLIRTEDLAVGKLLIDKRYQRPLEISKLRRLLKEWDINKCDHLRVSQRFGVTDYFYVFDGQHRLEAARQLFGDAYLLPCRVEALSEEEEADRFASQHDIETKVGAKDRFFAKLFAEDPIALEIQAAVEESGWKLVPRDMSIGNTFGYVQAYGALMQWHDRIGVDGLKRALTIIINAWDQIPEACDGRTIESVSRFIELYGDRVDDQLVIKKFSETTPKLIRQKSQDYNNVGRIVGMTRALVERYNKNARAGKMRLNDRDDKD